MIFLERIIIRRRNEMTVSVQIREESGVRITMHTRRNMGGPEGETVFDFRMGLEPEGPAKFLGCGQGFCRQMAIRPTMEMVAQFAMWAAGARRAPSLSIAVKVNGNDSEAPWWFAWTRCF
jgi:hypothetical protein